MPTKYRPKQLGNHAQKLARIMHSTSLEVFYQQLVTCWEDPGKILQSSGQGFIWPKHPDHLSSIEQMQYLDTQTYLPEDILAKVDRASMAVALEARVPLLDHRIIESAWQLPETSKHRPGQAKWLLKQVLNQYVPASLFDRPKMGFGIP